MAIFKPSSANSRASEYSSISPALLHNCPNNLDVSSLFSNFLDKDKKTPRQVLGQGILRAITEATPAPKADRTVVETAEEDAVETDADARVIWWIGCSTMLTFCYMITSAYIF